MSTNEEQREFLRERVRELAAKSLTQREIASKMHVSPATVNRTLQHLRQQAKDNISKYVDETLPYEYDRILCGIDNIIKNCWAKAEGTSNNREHHMYMALAKDAYQVRASLLDSGTIIERAVRFIDNTRGLTIRNRNPTIDSGGDNTAKPTQTEKGEKDVSSKPKQSN